MKLRKIYIKLKELISRQQKAFFLLGLLALTQVLVLATLQIMPSKLADNRIANQRGRFFSGKAPGSPLPQFQANPGDPGPLGLSDDFHDLQWGLDNQGIPQFIDIDPLQYYRHQAKRGEDISPLLEGNSIKTPPKKILVAVLDTGIDFSHPDLQGMIHENPSECAALKKFQACVIEKNRKECEVIWMDKKNPEVDQDGNGFPLDCHGWSFASPMNQAKILGQPDFEDVQGHGTHVAGVIAALRNNKMGINGVSSNVEILPVQVIRDRPVQPLKPLSFDLNPVEPKPISDSNVTLADLIARAIRYAILSKAQVISMSLGWPQAQDSALMREAIKEAQARGIIIVAAAGNDSTRALLRPCSYEGVICVGAHRPDGSPAHFSNYGSGVDINAPGVNILSTYPTQFRPILFRSSYGYEYLSGTSQAVPFVSGAVAELLSRGVSAKEIYARLVLSARPQQEELPLLVGLAHEQPRVVADSVKRPYEKYSLSGNLDMRRALAAKAQSFITPIEKEKIAIPWDRKSRDLLLKLRLKNHWQDYSGNPQVFVQTRASVAGTPIPKVISVQAKSGAGIFRQGEIREYEVLLRIDDTANAEDTRIASEFDLDVKISGAGLPAVNYVVTAEISIALTADFVGKDIVSYQLGNFPQARVDWVPVYDNLDGYKTYQDYFLIAEPAANKKQIWVARQDDESGPYGVFGGTVLKIQGDDKKISEVRQFRMDWDFDGGTDYAIAFVEDKKGDIKTKTNPYTFFVMDNQMSVKKEFVYNDERAQMASNFQWQKVGGHRMPAWIVQGKDPNKVRDLWEIWSNPDYHEELSLRFYFLNEEGKLQALDNHEGYAFVDLMAPRIDQEIDGRVPVLLAKNRGTEIKPSYIYDFAVAEVIDGKVENFRPMRFFEQLENYRNLLDTRVDRILSLDKGDAVFNGTMWFGQGLAREQRVSTFDTYKQVFADYRLRPLRKYYDGALFTRATFSGQERKGSFVFTNSDIQYHDLLNGKVLRTSLDRYSFFPRDAFLNIQFPIALGDTKSPNSQIPALFTTEGTGLSRGLKVTAVRYDEQDQALELFSPARLRFASAQGCKSLEAPMAGGPKGSFIDYYCGQKLLRVYLRL